MEQTDEKAQEKVAPVPDGVLVQDASFIRRTYHQALLPGILSILSGTINVLADGILVGQRVGVDGLAAVNLCTPVYLLLCIIGSFLVSGTAIEASKAMGGREQTAVTRYYSTAVWGCLAASLLVTVLGLVLLEPLCVFLCSDQELVPLVRDYAGVTVAGALPKIMLYVPFWFLRLDGHNRTITVMMALMGGGNVVLDILFLYAFNWGVFGAALASVIATAAACVLGFAKLVDKKSSFHLTREIVRDVAGLRGIAVVGSPSALNNLFQTLRLLAVNSLLMRAGGSGLVAVFTAVNGVAAFADCVISGVPQAASAMLGVYSGEQDNGSARLLLRQELKSGTAAAIIFSLIAVAGSGLIGRAYGLEISLTAPMLWLSLGLFPGMMVSVLSNYYNIAGRSVWSGVLLALRVFAFSSITLWVLVWAEASPWPFLFAGEALTLAVWYLATALYHRCHPELSRFLLMDDSLERSGRTLNISIPGNTQAICSVAEQITSYCEQNGMDNLRTMRISLAMEELMTLTVQENEGAIVFDVRLFAMQDVFGIRIRYNGRDFNPLLDAYEAQDEFMGIVMIKKLVKKTVYQRTFGVNTLIVLV